MAKSVLNEHIENYRKRFQTILEYTQVNGVLNEAEPEEDMPTMGDAADNMGGDPMGGGAPDAGMGSDPMAGDTPPSGGMGGDPMSGGAPDAGMGGAQQGGAEGQGVEGLNPQGGAPDAGMGGDPMSGDTPMADDGAMEEGPVPGDDAVEDDDVESMEEDDEVIDVDELTSYQQKTAKGVGKISDELKALRDLITNFEDKVNANNQGIEDLKRELQKRAPNAEEKITLRKAKSGPFTQNVEDYRENNAPENYKVSGEDDINNPKYVITKSDIDGISDWNSISKSFDEMAELNDLRNIFGI